MEEGVEMRVTEVKRVLSESRSSSTAVHDQPGCRENKPPENSKQDKKMIHTVNTINLLGYYSGRQ